MKLKRNSCKIDERHGKKCLKKKVLTDHGLREARDPQVGLAEVLFASVEYVYRQFAGFHHPEDEVGS